ncbi:hypothetical protein SDC9_119854 [bioreactor metagenome]|uniref:Uncharacterized protein n=1 Tax=bioreactor metagenome TaxID=1076179 RepID=A0A645C680_9ZZZZ
MIEGPAVSVGKTFEGCNPVVACWSKNSSEKYNDQQDGCYICYKKPEYPADFDIGSGIDFRPSFFDAEEPCKQNSFKGSKDKQGKRTCPVIVFIEDALIEKQNRWHSDYQNDNSKCDSRLFP